MFDQLRGKEATPNRVPDGNFNMVNEISTNNGITKNACSQNILKGNSITVSVNYAQNVFYQKNDFCASVNILVLKSDWLSKNKGLFVTSIISRNNNFKYDYGSKISKDRLNNDSIQLPVKNGKIDFKFMESFITELEVERIEKLKSYLIENGLDDYKFTDEEKLALKNYENLNWSSFNLENLFGKSTRGKRLKSTDRIAGTLPFITAGETNEGISAFIGNDVAVFSANTTTIDMFGSAKYRNFEYGGDDHIAVVHTEKLPKYASAFVTSAIHKSSYNGQFNYGKNFYAKDADNLNIQLPTKNNKPDFTFMQTFISAIQKLVIKDLVLYADQKIEATKKAVRYE